MLTVTTPVGKKAVCEWYFPKCRVQIEEYEMPADLIVLAMHDFDVILGRDWLAKYHACMDCFNKTTFKIDEASVVVIFEGAKKSMDTRLFSAIKAERLVRSGCEGYIAFILFIYLFI